MANPDILGTSTADTDPEFEEGGLQAYASKRRTIQKGRRQEYGLWYRYGWGMLPHQKEPARLRRQLRNWKELVMDAIEEAQENNPGKLITVEPEVLNHPNCGIRISKQAESGITSFPSNGGVPEGMQNLGHLRNSMVKRIIVAMLDKFGTVTLTQSARINAAAKAYINGLLLNRKMCDSWESLTPDQVNALLNGESRLTEKFADAMDELGLDSVSQQSLADMIAGFQAEARPAQNITVNVLNQTGETPKPVKQSAFLEVPDET